jgi:DNA-binding LacI/PurR family transcriptional regulator
MATMQDVANMARVSLSTVSYAISGSRPVSAATRERIEEAMRQLDFRPNAIARSLASRRSRILALTFPAVENRFGNTIMEFVSSAAAAARDSGYHLVVWPYAVDQADEMCDMSQQGLADGVIVMEVRVDDPRIEALSAARVPFTLIGRGRPDTDNRSVDIDFDATAEAAVSHLTDLGHRQIGFLNHSESSRQHGYGPTVRAQDAYRAAMARRGLAPFTRYCDENPLAGRAAMKAMREQNPALTALVAMNEDALFGVVAELHRQGVVVPDDFSLVSMLSSRPVAEMVDPVMTTLHSPGAELGRLGVRHLLHQLDDFGEVTAPALIPGRLELGASTGPVPAR